MVEGKKTSPDQPMTHGWGRTVLRVLRIPAVKVRRVFRRQQMRLRTHRSGFCTLSPYGASDDVCGEASMTQREPQNNDRICDSVAATDDRQKRSLRKRVKKTLRRSMQHYGDSAVLCGSPLSTVYMARDIQQRIAFNHKYVEMQDIYIPSTSFY